MHNTTEILRQIISYNTAEEAGVRACYDYVRALLKAAGMKIETIFSDKGDNLPAVLWGTLPSATGEYTGGAVLSGHLDVVPSDAKEWHTDPYTLTEKDGRLYARGSCDMKGFLACALSAVQGLQGKKIHQPIHICMSFDEETDMLGIKKIAPLLQKYKPDWCWVGEPSDMKMIDSHLGCVTGDIELKGVPAHGSTPHKGLSAIDMALDIIDHIRVIAREKKAHPFLDSGLENPYTVFNIGTIHGGSASNVVAERCSFSYQYRPHPDDSVHQINQSIESFIIREIMPRCQKFVGAGLVSHNYQIDDPLVGSRGVAFQNISALLNDRETKTETYVTEAGFFQKNGIPTIVCGPGSIEQAHRFNEFVPVKDLKKCHDMLLTFANYLCHGKGLSLAQYVSLNRQNCQSLSMER